VPLALVTVKGTPFVITDICLRMLQPSEQHKAQGFPSDYIISHVANGKLFTKTQQVHVCGNSVSPRQWLHLLRQMIRGAQSNAMQRRLKLQSTPFRVDVITNGLTGIKFLGSYLAQLTDPRNRINYGKYS